MIKLLLLVVLLFGASLLALAYAGSGAPGVDTAAIRCAQVVRTRFPHASVSMTIAGKDAKDVVRALIYGDIIRHNIPYVYEAKCLFLRDHARIEFHAHKDLRTHA